MTTKQVDVTSLKKGSYVIFEGIPCRVTDVQISKTGKHGHAKCRVSAVGLIEDKKIIKVMPGHDKVDVPIVDKRGAQVLSVQSDKANVMDLESYETFEIDIPEEFREQVKEGHEVLYWVILEKRVIKQLK